MERRIERGQREGESDRDRGRERTHYGRKEVYQQGHPCPLGFRGRVGNPSVSLQRCLVQVAFQPILPQDKILEEAIQLLGKETETKTVREVV